MGALLSLFGISASDDIALQVASTEAYKYLSESQQVALLASIQEGRRASQEKFIKSTEISASMAIASDIALNLQRSLQNASNENQLQIASAIFRASQIANSLEIASKNYYESKEVYASQENYASVETHASNELVASQENYASRETHASNELVASQENYASRETYASNEIVASQENYASGETYASNEIVASQENYASGENFASGEVFASQENYASGENFASNQIVASNNFLNAEINASNQVVASNNFLNSQLNASNQVVASNDRFRSNQIAASTDRLRSTQVLASNNLFNSQLNGSNQIIASNDRFRSNQVNASTIFYNSQVLKNTIIIAASYEKYSSEFVALLKAKRPIGVYIIESLGTYTSSIPNLISNSYGAATCTNITQSTFNGIPQITGTTTSKINWPSNLLQPSFTICSLTRYTGASNQKRILQGKSVNFVHGHYNTNVGLCFYHETWYTGQTTPTNIQKTDWLAMSGSNKVSEFNGENFLANSNKVGLSLPGLFYRVYTNYMNDSVNFFDNNITYHTSLVTSTNFNNGITTNLSNKRTGTNSYLPNDNSQRLYSIQWVGYFKPDVTGTWTFWISSDDCSYLWLGNSALTGYTRSNALINNGGLHGMIELSNTISLTAGVSYPVRIQFGENDGGDEMIFSFQGPTGSTASTKTSNLSGFFTTIPSSLISTSNSFFNNTSTNTLSINDSSIITNENSDFGFSQLLVWDQPLTNSELSIVNKALTSYTVSPTLYTNLLKQNI
jgi:hypothetical protein